MKKLIFAVAIACVGAQFAHAEQVQNWFTGGVNGTTPTAENGAWPATMPADVTVAGGKFTLELDYDSALEFTPTVAAAPDTNVMTRVTVCAKFEPGTSTLPTLTEAKTALTVSNDTYYAYAKVGDKMGWVALTGTPSANAVDILVEVDYKYATARARYGIISGTTTNYLKAVGAEDGSWLTLVSTPAPALIASVSFTGEGELTSVRGDVQLGVAAYAGVKYPELQDAIDAAGDTQDAKITLLRNVADTAEIPANVTIDTNGKEMAGEVKLANGATIETSAGDGCINLANYEFPSGQDEYVNLNLKDEATEIESGDTVVATGAASGHLITVKVNGKNTYKDYSELVIDKDSRLVCKVKTSDAQVNAIALGGASKLAGTSNADLRTFMKDYVSSYSGAESTTANMQTQLAATGSNNMPLWQSFVLGIKPTETLATQPTGTDDDKKNIHIEIPAVSTKDSGFTVSYKVNETTVSDPKDIQIPVGTDTYTIKAVLSPKN